MVQTKKMHNARKIAMVFCHAMNKLGMVQVFVFKMAQKRKSHGNLQLYIVA